MTLLRPSSAALLLLLSGSGGWAVAAEKPQAPALVPPPPTLDERVSRVEQVLQSQSLVEMLARIDALQQENNQLRGELEEQAHLVEELKQRLADVYRDLDRRVSQMERVAAPASGSAATAPTAAATSTPPATAPAQAAAESAAYQKAFDLLRELRYEQASEAFTAFLKSYPNGRYAPMAQYWLAEAGYARRDFAGAVADYQTLVQRFPDSPKVAESLLKSGYAQLELGKKAEAQQAFAALVERFPQSPEAQQAQASLKRLSEEAAAKGR